LIFSFGRTAGVCDLIMVIPPVVLVYIDRST
jgi:hypothetical protein